ncbi:hypothetical protein [Candidatus Sororendozoicomonas aggregata]|uniref:hypothetical protein n=1 Tax=Candidatus Sororendozoicomonas aggregata TaxID=3073239 RepID=UPI002ED54FBF
MSFSALAIQYAGVGGYGHAMFVTSKYYLDTTTGTSESAVKKALKKICHGKCDAEAITAQGDAKPCGAVGLDLGWPAWYVRSKSVYARSREQAELDLGVGFSFTKAKSICAPTAIEYRLDFDSQRVEHGFPQSVEKNFPSLIRHYLKDKDGNWKRNITAAIAGDFRNPSKYYFLLDNKTYIWFDGDDSKFHGPVSLEKSKEWPGITKAIGSNTIVAGLYYPLADETYFFLSNNTCFQFSNGHISQPKPVADIFGDLIQKSISANNGLLTAFYDPDKKAHYFFFKNGKYSRFDKTSTHYVWGVDSTTWPGIDYDSFTNAKYYNKFMINIKQNKIYDLVLRKAS